MSTDDTPTIEEIAAFKFPPMTICGIPLEGNDLVPEHDEDGKFWFIPIREGKWRVVKFICHPNTIELIREMQEHQKATPK